MKDIKLSDVQLFARLRGDVKAYRKATGARRYFIPSLGLYMGKCFSMGNRKLSSNIAIFRLKEIFTCLNCKDCAKDCYAVKSSRQYPNVNNHRWLMSYVAINHADLLETWIRKELSNMHNIDYVRIHESGDFFLQSYVDMWARIARDFPRFRFYFYTKVAGVFDFSKLVNLNNVNMVESVLSDGGINFDVEDKITKRAHALGVPLCPYRKGGAPVHCGTDCKACMTSKYVAFIKH